MGFMGEHYLPVSYLQFGDEKPGPDRISSRRDFVIRAAAPLGRLHSREDPIARQQHRIVWEVVPRHA